jgi:hypothetical protein
MDERQSFAYRIGAIMPVTPEKKLAHVVVAQLLESKSKEKGVLDELKTALILTEREEKIILETIENIIYYHKVMAGID